MGQFIIIPEPSIADLARSGFSVDKAAMAEHYSALFAGKRFDAVHDMLEANGLTYNVKDERRLVFQPVTNSLDYQHPILARLRYLLRTDCLQRSSTYIIAVYWRCDAAPIGG